MLTSDLSQKLSFRSIALASLLGACGCSSDASDPDGLGGAANSSAGASSSGAPAGGTPGGGKSAGGAGSGGTAGTGTGSGGTAGTGTGSGGTAGTGSGGTAGTGTGSGGTAGTGGGACTDVYRLSDGYSCAQQAGWGKCSEPWMADSCDLSCGRCGDLGAECGAIGMPPDLLADPGPAPPVDCTAAPADSCPFAGLKHACKERFALGVNYAWRNFGTDFGGLVAWDLKGVSGNAAVYNQDLANMKANGAGVIRWWVFPDMRGDAVEFDASGSPTGITATAIADVQKALELAQQNDVYLVLTVFSFDAFRPKRTESGGLEVLGISPLVESETGRAALATQVVAPLARAVAQSPYASRLLGWDVINEPEWAIEASGTAPSGKEFDPIKELDAVPLSDMVAFIKASLSTLKAETPHALRSVGWAAAKWSWAFADVTEVEFNQPHIYAWVNTYWPYSTAPRDLGYPDRPVVMGEFYLVDGPFDAAAPSFDDVMNHWYDAGYAGAWPWQYFDGCIARPGTQGLDFNLIGNFSKAKGCTVTF